MSSRRGRRGSWERKRISCRSFAAILRPGSGARPAGRFRFPLPTDVLQSIHRFLTTFAVCGRTLEAMQPLRPSIAIILSILVASVFVLAGERPAVGAEAAAKKPAAVGRQGLQGTWKGSMVGQEKDGIITVTITGSALHFHRDTNFWFETTFTLADGKDPHQLHATLRKCPAGQESSVGQVVVALYQVENGTLTLVPLSGNGSDEETPRSFEAAEEKGLNRYELRKVQPQKASAEGPSAQ